MEYTRSITNRLFDTMDVLLVHQIDSFPPARHELFSFPYLSHPLPRRASDEHSPPFPAHQIEMQRWTSRGFGFARIQRTNKTQVSTQSKNHGMASVT